MVGKSWKDAVNRWIFRVRRNECRVDAAVTVDGRLLMNGLESVQELCRKADQQRVTVIKLRHGDERHNSMTRQRPGLTAAGAGWGHSKICHTFLTKFNPLPPLSQTVTYGWPPYQKYVTSHPSPPRPTVCILLTFAPELPCPSKFIHLHIYRCLFSCIHA